VHVTPALRAEGLGKAFAGVTALALLTQVHYTDNPCDLHGWAACASSPQPSVVAQIATAVFGANSIPFFVVQVATAAVLLLAANTAFNGFPLLSSVLAKEEYAPKSLNTRGDRLVLSNGVIALAIGAAILIIAFEANVSALIQLYVIGVFTSFTLGQSGMIIHWRRALKRMRQSGKPLDTRQAKKERRGLIGGLLINSLGTVLVATVLVIVTITKFTHGAWVVFILMPVLWVLMRAINRYYARIKRSITPDRVTEFGSNGDHAIVLVGELTKPTLKALDYAIAMLHDSLEAVHVAIDEDAARKLVRQWDAHNIQVPLTILDSPYRGISEPLIQHIAERRATHGSEVITVYISEYVVGHWWQRILHNHRSRRIESKLMLVPGVTVSVVPWVLDEAKLVLKRPPRPMPGDARRGEPGRPPIRRHITMGQQFVAAQPGRSSVRPQKAQ